MTYGISLQDEEKRFLLVLDGLATSSKRKKKRNKEIKYWHRQLPRRFCELCTSMYELYIVQYCMGRGLKVFTRRQYNSSVFRRTVGTVRIVNIILYFYSDRLLFSELRDFLTTTSTVESRVIYSTYKCRACALINRLTTVQCRT